MVDCASTFFAGGFRPPAGREGGVDAVVAAAVFVGSEGATQRVSNWCESSNRLIVRGLFSCLLAGSAEDGTSAVLVVDPRLQHCEYNIPPHGESSILIVVNVVVYM